MSDKSKDTRFKEGNPGGPGGKREGAGRPPNWYREEADKLIHDKKLIHRVARMANGEPVLEKTFMIGKGKKARKITIKMPADGGTQVYAFKELGDRAWGKAPQAIEVTPDTMINLFAAIERARQGRGLNI